MKTVLKWGAMLTVTVGLTLGGLYAIAGDSFMPWVPQEDVYVATSEAQGQADPEGGYNYTSHYISKTGKEGNIAFYAPGKLRTGAYIKLEAKGNYVASWEEVQADELPASIQSKFNAN